MRGISDCSVIEIGHIGYIIPRISEINGAVVFEKSIMDIGN